jgi:uncharacterized protein YfiM (DUF2279 family)
VGGNISQSKCDLWGGRDKVKAFLIQDIGTAAGVAAELDRGGVRRYLVCSCCCPVVAAPNWADCP